MIEYITEGIWIFKDSLLLGIIIFLIFQTALILLKKRKWSEYVTISKLQFSAEYVLSIYVCVILRITGIIGQELHFYFSPGNLLGFLSVPFAGASCLMVTLNFLLFVPYGFLCGYVFQETSLHIKHALLLGCASSFCIEVIQAFTGRMTEIDDLLINTAGFVVGYLLEQAVKALIVDHQIKTGLLRSSGIIAVSAALLFLLSFIANGDALQKAEHEYYNGIGNPIGTLDEELASISDIHIIHNGKTYNITETSGLYDELWYTEAGTDISNMSGQYECIAENADVSSVIVDEANYLEVNFSSPQTFRFYNNRGWVMENVRYLLYRLDNGELWYGKDFGTITHHAIYIGKDYPFRRNETLQEGLTEMLRQ